LRPSGKSRPDREGVSPPNTNIPAHSYLI
jgi:hypothetical protein